MKSNVITFKQQFQKLTNNTFSTIRRHNNYKLGQIYEIKTPETTFNAELVKKEHKTLKEIETLFLMIDTDTDNREEAITLLNSFYKKPIKWNDELVILFFERVNSHRVDYKSEERCKCPECL